jgi:hypothetical protein
VRPLERSRHLRSRREPRIEHRELSLELGDLGVPRCRPRRGPASAAVAAAFSARTFLVTHGAQRALGARCGFQLVDVSAASSASAACCLDHGLGNRFRQHAQIASRARRDLPLDPADHVSAGTDAGADPEREIGRSLRITFGAGGAGRGGRSAFCSARRLHRQEIREACVTSLQTISTLHEPGSCERGRRMSAIGGNPEEMCSD